MSLLKNTFVTFQHHIIIWVTYFIHLFLISYWQVNDTFCWLLTAQYDVTASCMQRNQNFIFESNILRCCGYNLGLFTALCQIEGQIASSYSISGQFESNSQLVNIERLFALFWFMFDYKKHIHILLKKVFCCSRLPSPISRLSRLGFW